MPGPASDSYDPEFSTGEVADEIRDALARMHEVLTEILGGRPPIYIGDLVRNEEMKERIGSVLTEKQWRLLRFACERARDSI